MKLSNGAIRRPTSVFTLVVVIVIGGMYCYVKLPREAAPDITIPIITVTTTYRDVAPVDIESLITTKIEKKLKGLADVEEIRSTSSEGRSFIMIEFTPDVDIDDAMQKVRDKVEQVKGDLPEEADEPTLGEINVSEFPIMSIAVYADRSAEGKAECGREAGGMENVSLVRLKKLAEDLKDRLEQIKGVLQVNVVGGREREIHILVNPDRLTSYKIPVVDLLTLVERENVNVSGGKIESADAGYQVRVPGEFTHPLEVNSLIVTRRGGRPVYLLDVARLRDGFADRTQYSRFRRGAERSARENITITIQKRSGENVVRIAREAKRILAESDDIWRQGIAHTLTMDMSDDIAMMVASLENNVFSGFVLVIAVVLLFMGFRNSLFVAVAIPLSMLITFGVLTALGITLNMVVLFALILALGMLVDNAIVIVENIYRHMQEGMPRMQAAMEATAEVAWPVTTSTLTTVAAFTPMLFWPGIVGKFMGFLPKTVIITLLSSLFVALVINPVFCATMMKVKKGHRGGHHEEQRKEPWLTRFYGWVLRLVLANRMITVLISVMALVTVVIAFFGWGTGVEFFPETEPPRCRINIETSEGALLDNTNRIARKVEERLLDIPDIDYVTTNVGSGGGHFFQGAAASSNLATVSVEFVDRKYRLQSSDMTIKQIRHAMADVPGATIDVQKEKKGPPTGEAVEVEVSGEDVDMLARIVPGVYARIKDVPGLVDLKDDLVASRPEIQFPVDRNRAALAGMSTTWVAQFIKMYVRGIKIGEYREGDEEYDITLRMDDEYRYDLNKLRAQYVPAPSGNMVPLSSLAGTRFVGGYGNIKRVDHKRAITIIGRNAEGYNAKTVLGEAKKRLANFRIPTGCRIRFRGEDEESEKASAFLKKALVASLMLIGLLLITQFNSLSLPFIIMAAVLMSFVGVFGGLLGTGLPFGIIMTGIGVIGLAGVVVNNGIVLIAYTRQLEGYGLDTYSAVVKAGKTRLRPVLLTAITTCLGLLPMAIGVSFDIHEWAWDLNSESSQWWRNMAVSVIFGLSVATFLTLLVEPALYSLFASARAWWKGLSASEGESAGEDAPAG